MGAVVERSRLHMGLIRAAAGATVVNGEGVIANLTPDDDAAVACKALGAALAK